jgi:hypothetical protein
MKNSFPTKRYPRMWLERLRHNLGGCPALMSVRLGTKKRARRATLCTNDANLRKNNIAVLQGTSSQRYGRSVFDCGGVRSIDFDGNEEAGIDGNEIAKMFFKVNPHMAWSFRTIGARGPNVWFITHGECPTKTKLYNASGVAVADFQSGPGYQILQGRHPSGVPYRIQVDTPAFEIDVTSLMWIDGRRLVDHIKYHKEGGVPFRREKTQELPETVLAPEEHSRPQIKGKAPDVALKLVAKYLPTAPHQTDANHWALSGDLLAQGIKLSVVEALAVGRHYYDLSDPNYLNGQSREAYAREFQHRHSLRKFAPSTGDGTLTKALERTASEKPPHDVLEAFPEDKRIHVVATLCRELARESANKRFFLGHRTITKLTKCSLAKATATLRDLEAIGLIVKIKTGNIRSEMLRGKIRAGGRASEFLYLGAIEPLRQLRACAQTKRSSKPILR